MANIKMTGLNKAYGAVNILKNINLDIKSGEFMVFVGPSGCGKSTLLRSISGLESITSGTLEIDGQVVNDVPPSKRGIAMVFQSYALYPHMSVYENIAFTLENAGVPRDQIKAKVEKVSDMLQLTPMLTRLPKNLSGGQRQRVAIGRAIVRDPKVFLFDEPLSNLDAALRVQMRFEISRLKKSLPNTTMVYVTHDQVEAMTMADRIAVLRSGNIEQVGAPLHLYNHPDNLFVAGFIGSPQMNFIKTEIASASAKEAKVAIPGGGHVVVAAPGRKVGEKVTLGIRPEHLTHDKKGPIAVVAANVEQLGESHLVYARLADGTQILVRGPGQTKAKADETLTLAADPAVCHLFDEAGMRISV
jgi:multiple sugar transport system ATP-binding protein